MNESGVKIEVHLIQNFSPANLNRDDTGQPKSATFGGFRRARISSQCSKKCARDLWRENGSVPVGDRTKKLQELIAAKLDGDKDFAGKVRDPELRKAGIRAFAEAYFAGVDKKKPENTSVLIFISPAEVEVCAAAIKELWEDKTRTIDKKGKKTTETVEGIGSVVKKLLEQAAKSSGALGEDESDSKGDSKRPRLEPVDEITERIRNAQVSADIALFGRMLAEHPGRNTDGACQVAHPISTHKVDMEMDFYTAVDDLNPAEETGAGMMGVVGFNSACFYRYALVDRDQLARNLAQKTDRVNGAWRQALDAKDYQEADKVIKAFLDAMVYAIPTGKQHSFAAQNLPSFGLFVVREGGVPLSLANAFARPVRPTKADDDLVGLSVGALVKHWEALHRVYGENGLKAKTCFQVEQEQRLGSLGDSDKGSVEKAVKAALEAVRGK